ncbi:hypothetical protein V8C35DRAFT_286750 [Trichoderma chlorosporum]
MDRLPLVCFCWLYLLGEYNCDPHQAASGLTLLSSPSILGPTTRCESERSASVNRWLADCKTHNRRARGGRLF